MNEDEGALRETIRKNPIDAGAHYHLGEILEVYESTSAEAENEFREAIRIDPGNIQYRRTLVNFLNAYEKYDEAMVEETEIIRIKPNDADAHLGLSIWLENQGRYDEADKEYKEYYRLRDLER